MKNLILIFGLVITLTSCGTVVENSEVKADSTSVTVDTTVAIMLDTTNVSVKATPTTAVVLGAEIIN